MPTQVPKIEIHDESARIVKGFGTVDVFDKVNERLPIDEFKSLMPILMKRGGLIMNRHTNQPVGKILNYEFKMKSTPEGPREGVYLTTEVFKDFASDDEVWDSIKKGETEGFSFGGRNTLEDIEFSKGISKKTLKGLESFEFSYVPKGCNQEATIEEVNYIAKEDLSKEEGETSTDSDHYHLYRIDDAGNGETLGTLPREADDHKHKIESGIVTLENGHSHELVRELVDRTNKNYEKPKSEKVEEIEKAENSDDKTLSKSDSTLNSEAKNGEKFIKNDEVSINMGDEEGKKTDTKKVEEAPQAADSQAPTDPIVALSEKMDKIIQLLSGNTMKADKEEDKEEDKEKVEKEGDGEKVKLPESEGDEVSQAKPAEGDKGDEAGANFLTKDDAANIAKEAASAVLKGLNNPAADTPRVGVKSNDIKKSEGIGTAKNWAQANQMIKKAGLQ